jgi:hypothetical protein
MKEKIALILVGAVAGLVLAFFLFSQAQYRGCAFNLKIAYPPEIGFDCAGAPHQVAVDFGSRPSRMSLGEALKIIAERTQSRGSARVLIDQSVLSLPAAGTKIDPPAGPQPSLDIIQQLIAQANANEEIGVLLVPHGGYQVRALK